MTDIVIFGTASRGSETLAILSQLPEYQVVAFSCNSQEQWGGEKEGLPVVSPESISKRYKDAVVVIASVPYYIEIRKQLLDGEIVPAERCLESVHEIIGKLPDEERNMLKSRLEGTIAFYNLDYKEVKLPAVQGTEDKYLIICGVNYMKCMFTHDRVLEYKNAGLNVEVFSLVRDASFEEYDYEGVHVYQGGTTELKKLLLNSNYKKLLIHFLEEETMYAICQAGKADMPMIVWCHGYEVEPWSSRWFCYTPREIEEKQSSFCKADNGKRGSLSWSFARENIQFIFVSDWLAKQALRFVGILPKHYCVIHNYINCDFWNKVPEKTPQDRCHILSVKSHGTRTYANDLTAKAILELSKKEFFQELTFELYGDGVLFEQNYGELIRRNFSNVHIHREMLNHEQMRERFCENGIFLSPSRLDSHQVTQSEAMAAGMSVITTNITSVRDFIDEDCGSLFEFDNYWMMAEEIEYLFYHPEDFLRKSKNAVQRIKNQCGYEQTIARELQLIVQ